MHAPKGGGASIFSTPLKALPIGHVLSQGCW